MSKRNKLFPVTIGNEFETSTTCTNCAAKFSGSFGLKQGKPDDAEGYELRPSAGAFTLCAECGHIMAFGDDLQLRELTDKEAISIAGHPLLIAAQQARLAGKKNNDQRD